MSSQIKIVDISFNNYPDCDDPQQVAAWTHIGHGYADHIADAAVTIIKHLNFEGMKKIYGRHYAFFKMSAALPVAALKYVRSLRPDVVLVQGLLYPIQLMLLRKCLPAHTKIIAQHHGEQPFHKKRFLQSLADRYVDAYLFTAQGNAVPWIEAGIIKKKEKIHEVPEASTTFRRVMQGGQKLMNGTPDMLWVGRLNSNKDPITALKGFASFRALVPDAKLYMIFGTDDLLAEVKECIAKDDRLKNGVELIGAVPHDQLPDWFSSASFYLSASHREGSGYALMEALACGCTPVISDIPTFRKISGDGSYGYLFRAGDAASLCTALMSAYKNERALNAGILSNYFQTELSFERIASMIRDLCRDLTGK